jgi:REP element-mobilizing transposase RayT
MLRGREFHNFLIYRIIRDNVYYTGHHFWARGYYVSTVGRDEAVIREYIRTQEAEDRRLDQMDLW